MTEKELQHTLSKVCKLLEDTAEDRRNQANMFYGLLEQQAKAIADSEQRIGYVNSMVSNLINFCSSMKEERAVLSHALEQSLQNYEGLAAQLRKLTELFEAEKQANERLQLEHKELLDKFVQLASAGSRSENKIEIKK